ncbi:mannan endo-1,6-alpha-mannosidase Dcw1p [Trichomonascus vanleenenianus]|uniref:glycoside hydrolase family 76 protein n=1 Tax=Trichomonascus vanleenenianus TaxID=2268995 RepID=UPI003ECAD4DB
MKLSALLLAVMTFFRVGLALDLDLDSSDSVNSALKLIAAGLMDYYDGNRPGGVIGMFVAPYYWWEAGAAWNSLLDYWYYTGDDTYNDVLKQSLLYQVGTDNNYMPSNQTTTEGNDDQAFWGITAMTAAEKNFSNPSSDQPQWLYLAQAVFNTMAARWDPAHCNGGLRWQIFTWNSGYDYKNTVSNGCLFHIGARLQRYTGNETYGQVAEKAWNWLEEVGFVTPEWRIYDGASIESNCTTLSEQQWTYNHGLLLSGAAYMYNHTGDSKWLDRVESLWSAAQKWFFQNNDIMYEASCQPSGRCNNDQRCFKAIFSRFLGLTAILIPSVRDEIIDYLRSSAAAAALSCSGGSDGHTCGLNWFTGSWDGQYGMGEQMSALEVIQNTQVIKKIQAAGSGNSSQSGIPLTNSTGGSSKGSSSAGMESTNGELTQNVLKIQTKDRAGAAIITIVIIGGLLGTGFWMLK